ncbi:MAG TPA: Asp-tRNA(Asn)/Glu-tRNA(Gln) amidotransferase subunit GatB, partial [Bacilli bacterium]|nr:Asp-tRNA(Asn)/Glu-tRNA(Gln) amidotransferase subunit GatB [Bacilli bacterium]
VDLGLPGVLPTINKEAMRKALKTALALNCEIASEALFDRKNYYYPDLPKGYQITQSHKPFGINGYLNYFVRGEEKEVLIHDLHLEEDTALLDHHSNYSLIDYNRAGIPLMEIVTEPCLHSAEEAIAFLENLRNLLVFCNVSEARSDKGQIRCDVNVSLMKETDQELGTRTEMKGINSFIGVKAAILSEIKRQTEILDSGKKVVQETRRVADDGQTYAMREKVDAIDYKYFVEPNIPPLKIEKAYLEELKEEIPELQYQRIKRYENNGINLKEAEIIAKDINISNYFDSLVLLVDKKESARKWLITFVLGALNKTNEIIDDFFLTPAMLANMINKIDSGEISQLNGKEILTEAIEYKKDPIELIKEKGIKQIDNKEELTKYITEVIIENPKQVEAYYNGKEALANFFVGMVMKKTNMQANPVLTLKLVKEELEKNK